MASQFMFISVFVVDTEGLLREVMVALGLPHHTSSNRFVRAAKLVTPSSQVGFLVVPLQ